MNRTSRFRVAPRPLRLALLLVLASSGALAGQFVYEGRLDDFGQPANGRYDLRLSPFAQAKLGASLAAPTTFEGVEVKDGRFRLDVDLPLVDSDDAWFELAVRASGEQSFSAIPGRSKAIAAPLIGACWGTTGDSGSDPNTNFLGTTDNQPLVLRTANVQSLRIEPSTETFGTLPITRNMIGGSHANTVTAGVRGATIAGGGVPIGDTDPFFLDEAPNRVTDHYGTVGGGYGNRAGDGASTLSNRPFATVGGGLGNAASGDYSTVGGGYKNTATSGALGTVAGGAMNTVSAPASTVGGGYGNATSGSYSTVGGGESNAASGNYGAVGGGGNNAASGSYSTVGGGNSNCAGGDGSWAGGLRAKVRPGTDPGGTGSCSGLPSYPGGFGDQGTFVWADSQNAEFVSSGSNQFLVRAAGGIYFGTNSTVSIPADRFINTSTGAYLTNGGTWTNASSRVLKQDFADVDPLDVLGRVLALGISTWRYRGSNEGRHIGPMAEDFKAAFGLAGDGKSIGTVDADGVALAAIQGLNAKLEAERDALAQRVEVLNAESAELRARLERLEAMLTDDAHRAR